MTIILEKLRIENGIKLLCFCVTLILQNYEQDLYIFRSNDKDL